MKATILLFTLLFLTNGNCECIFNIEYRKINMNQHKEYPRNTDSILLIYDRLCEKMETKSLIPEHYDTIMYFINNFPDEGLSEGFGGYLYNLFLNNENTNQQLRLKLGNHSISYRKSTQLNLLSFLWLNLQENHMNYSDFLKHFPVFDNFFRLRKEYNKRYNWFLK